MEFLVIVLFVVAIVVVNFVMTRAQRRKGSTSPDAPGADGAQPDQLRAAESPRVARKTAGAKAASAGPRTSVEAAREANAKLNAAQHQQVYAAIAQGHPIGAVKLYAQFTGVGVRAAAVAVENLAMHPQPFQPPRPASAAANTPAPAGTRPDTPEQGTSAPRSDAAETHDAAETPAPAETPKTPGASGDGGPTGRKPATPEEDEISKWVKNLRPEDF